MSKVLKALGEVLTLLMIAAAVATISAAVLAGEPPGSWLFCGKFHWCALDEG